MEFGKYYYYYYYTGGHLAPRLLKRRPTLSPYLRAERLLGVHLIRVRVRVRARARVRVGACVVVASRAEEVGAVAVGF